VIRNRSACSYRFKTESVGDSCETGSARARSSELVLTRFFFLKIIGALPDFRESGFEKGATSVCIKEVSTSFFEALSDGDISCSVVVTLESSLRRCELSDNSSSSCLARLLFLVNGDESAFFKLV